MQRAGALLAGGLLFLQAGGGTGLGHAVDQINRSSTAPVRTVAPRAAARPDRVWVPDRYVAAPHTGRIVLVPGHWERPVSDHESYVPPLTVIDPADGRSRTLPAGVRPRAEERAAP
jgi:hypothetical protein